MFKPVVMAVPLVLVEPAVNAKLRRLPVEPAPKAKEVSLRELISPDVVVEVIDVVPKPVRPILPEVPVKDKAPVVKLKPPEVEIVPEVVIASPEVAGESVVPDLVQ